MAVATNQLVNLVMQASLTHFRQLMIETERQAARFRAGEIVAADAGIQPLHAVEDQTVDRVAGGKRQTTENIIIKLGEGVGVILHLPGAVQDRQRFIRMLAKRGADKNRGNVGAHGEQIINQLRYAVVIEARQRFEDIQA